MPRVEIALVIASPWIEKILAGQKTWEIRGGPNTRTGRIALARQGGPLVATCEIGPSIQLPEKLIEATLDKHGATRDQIDAIYGRRALYHAWPLSDVRPLDPPIEYQHPGGGAWVSLSPANVPEWARLQGA